MRKNYTIFNIDFSSIKLSRKGIYLERFIKDGYRWDFIEVETWSLFKIAEFIKKDTLDKKQTLICFYSPYVNRNKFKKSYDGQWTVRDISLFIENLKDIRTEDLVEISDMAMYVSDVVHIKGRPTAMYRFYIESNDKAEVKRITKKLIEYFTLKGGEVR